MMSETERQVQRVRRRMIETTSGPLIKRLQLMTMRKAPQRHELLDALILASIHHNEVEPVQRVYVCWERWMLVMHHHESFGAYARRNLLSRP